MNCKQCDKTVRNLNNYGNTENPLCYDCSVILEKERGINPEKMKVVNDFMCRAFKQNSSSKIVTSQLNIPYILVGVINIVGSIFIGFLGVSVISSFGRLVNYIDVLFIIGSLLILFFGVIGTFLIGLFCVLGGLYHIRSTINLKTRQVTITRRNWAFYKRKVTETFPLETIQINAILFTDVPTTWMVRIGCGDYAILSKEFYSVRERNAAMLALLKKIFPEYAYMDGSFIMEDGNQAFFKQQEIITP